LSSKRKPGEIYEMNIRFHKKPEAEEVGARLNSRVFVSPMGDNRYMVVAYGTQGSTKLADLPKHHDLHRVYDYDIPTQSLALVTTFLNKVGREGKGPVRIYVPGREMATQRKGVNRPEVHEELQRYSDMEHIFPRSKRRLFGKAAEKWGGLSTRHRQSLVDTHVPWHRLLSIPWHVIDRNYGEIPENLGAKKTPLGFVASQEVLKKLARKDPNTFDYVGNTHMQVHEIDPEKLSPMERFLKPPRKSKSQ
jgi:hypothetical protein